MIIGSELLPLSSYLRPCDFAGGDDDYAAYLRDHIAVGMEVSCCRGYDEVSEGDTGLVVQLDRDGLHDLNVQVEWRSKGGTYWVRYVNVEIIGFIHPTPAAASASASSSSNSFLLCKLAVTKYLNG